MLFCAIYLTLKQTLQYNFPYYLSLVSAYYILEMHIDLNELSYGIFK